MKNQWTKADIVAFAKEQNVRFIRLQFTDLLGTIKNVEIPVSQLEKALDNKMMFDGSSIEGLCAHRGIRYVLVSRPGYLGHFPMGDGDRVARLICDVYMPDGTPFAGDPRGILKRDAEGGGAMGFTAMNVGPEPEFFLFKTDEKGNPTMELNDQGGYFDLAPTDLGENCRREIVLTLKEMGFEIEASHHEVAPGQHEIDFKYADAVKAADQIQTFKLVVKTIARQHGLHATFMPKPLFGMNGSGMHCHQSLFRGKENAFYDPSDDLGLSACARQFMAGILKHARGYRGHHESDGQLLQTAGARLRSALLRSLVGQQPQSDGPHSGHPAASAPASKCAVPIRQPIRIWRWRSCCGRTGRHQAAA